MQIRLGHGYWAQLRLVPALLQAAEVQGEKRGAVA
jgi:hypothetical protein